MKPAIDRSNMTPSDPLSSGFHSYDEYSFFPSIDPLLKQSAHELVSKPLPDTPASRISPMSFAELLTTEESKEYFQRSLRCELERMGERATDNHLLRSLGAAFELLSHRILNHVR